MPSKTKTLKFTPMHICWKKTNRGQCCCNCKNRFAVHGHPWITGTSIMKPTGLYVCTSKEYNDKSRYFMASGKHGACEAWEPL